MDKHPDQETQKRLQDAVAKAKEARMEMERKQDAKRWADIGVPLRLEVALGSLTKEELSEVRRNLGVKHASTLNKHQLAAELARVVPECVHRLWPLFDQERYSFMQTIVRHGGVMPSPKLAEDRLDYFRNRGIVFTGTVDGKRMLVMPQEILETFRQIDDRALTPIVSRNSEWIKLSQGMLYYYGTLSLDEVESLIEQYTGSPVKTGDYLLVMDEAISYYNEMRMDEHGYSNIRVWDAEKVRIEHDMRPGVDYYPFTRKQLLLAGEPGFVDRTPVYREFVDFLLNNFEMKRKAADLIAEECAYAARMGEHLMSLVQFLQSQIELDSMEMLQKMVSQLTPFMNQTRQWFIKGYSPDELAKNEKKFVRPLPTQRADIIDMTTRKKIGRNDPCPCGSGKKFKRCCGGL